MRRVVATMAVLSVSLLGVTACGDDGGENTGSVTVTGKFGAEPKVVYDGKVTRVSTDYKTLIEGDGPEIKLGDTALINIYEGNGFLAKKASSTYDEGQKPVPVPVTKDVYTAFRKAIVGHRTGSRVQVLATPKDANAGQGNPESGLGNGDSVVLVIDIMDIVRKKPEGTETPLPAGLPTLVEKEGKVTAFDFAKAAATPPSKELQVVTLVEGDGHAVEKGDWIAMRYLGQAWKGAKPFDENYSAESIDPFQIGVGSLIKGWDQGLVGVKGGSRVLLVIPEALAYGPKPKKDDGKPHGDLIFVVDVLGVA